MKKIVLLFLLSALAQAQDFSKYLPKPIPAIGSFQYYNASYYTYDRYTENYEDSVIIKPIVGKSIEAFISQANKVILEANKDSIVNQLLLHSFISISNNTSQWEAIKYLKVIAKDTSAFQVLILKSENQKIIEDNESETSQIIKNILSLKSDIFSQFEYEEPNRQYADLKSMASQVKDTDGTLNLSKLNKYLKTKPKELAKYCDF